MRFPISLVAMSLALALPAVAQTYSSATSTVTQGGSTVQQSTSSNAAGGTSITGGTGDGTVSASGVVIDPQADRALLSRVVAELAANAAVQGAAIDVQVVGGRVTLNGATRDTNQAEAAKEIVKGVAGGANVVSNLTTGRQ